MLKDVEEITILSTYVKLVQGSSKRVCVNLVLVASSHRPSKTDLAFFMSIAHYSQEIRPVKVLGILCMIDEGEADWKVVTIDAEDKWAPFLNDIDDVEKHLPGTLSAIREWFRTYKIPDGKPPVSASRHQCLYIFCGTCSNMFSPPLCQNVFGLDEKFMDKHYALEIIKECNHAWKDLITGEKERKLDQCCDEVKGLVRKLSKSNLVDLAPMDDDEAPHF